MNDINAQAYITNVIAKIAADWPASHWDDLMPWNRQQDDKQPTTKAA